MPQDYQWGPANPHPLSTLRTELVWEGKYDEFGRRREVDVAALAMPMQRIETVDEPRQRAESSGQLALFEKQIAARKQDDFRNRLIWGDRAHHAERGGYFASVGTHKPACYDKSLSVS